MRMSYESSNIYCVSQSIVIKYFLLNSHTFLIVNSKIYGYVTFVLILTIYIKTVSYKMYQHMLTNIFKFTVHLILTIW
jgi:hypothetical protein